MKSIAFLRKAWRKWTTHHQDDEQTNGRWCEPQESASPSLTSIPPKSSRPPSQSYHNRPILRRNTSRFTRDTACGAQGSPTSSQSPIHDCNKLSRLSSQLPSSSTNHLQSLPCTLFPKDIENSVPYQTKFQVPQPLDASGDNLGSAHPYSSANLTHSTDTISSMISACEVQNHPENLDAALDLWVDAKPHTLRHRTRSMPYLRHEDEIDSTQAGSVNASEGNFPLSLFPTPPVLMARKKIPPPLMLRNSPPTSVQSSCDSTPVGTPTTPRFLPPHSPSELSFGSCRRLHSGRRVTSISPPPFSPPNSPLPSPPVCRENNERPLEYAGRPRIRTAYSSSNLKDALPFSATHRLTFSESISNQSSLPIKKSRKPRPEGMHAQPVQACLEAREQVTLTAVENNIQWGYAL